MNPNLDAYFWAEQTNRQRLPDQAARAWLAEQAAGPPANNLARLRRATGTLLVRAGTRLQGVGPVPSLAAPNGTLSRA